MALTSRISLQGPAASDPEDLLSSSLGVIFPDDVTNQHGDAEHSLLYASPHLPRPLRIALADPVADADRRLFSHYLWNASLLLAELVEAATLRLPPEEVGGSADEGKKYGAPAARFDVAGLATLELGAGTALPSVMAALLGARRVVATDYPSETVLATLRANAAANATAEHAPAAGGGGSVPAVEVHGHMWGDLGGSAVDADASFAATHRGAFDRVLACDCLWMPWQHGALRRSVAHFLRDDDAAARAWVVAGFHTGRAKMRGFLEADALRADGLAVESVWERDCDGVERPWEWDRGHEDVSERKRWLVVAVLRKLGPEERGVRG
ncbi:hypothetical protein GGR52DRAFT_468451 [Hypoxylon sp. FL1284]|nr:hypothetical protein GGR52DRAFT_468451 [Hypoxylon sp. FL1284]